MVIAVSEVLGYKPREHEVKIYWFLRVVLCVTCEQRPLVYHEKCLCVPTTNLPLSLKFAFFIFTKNLRSRL